jgi:hypothetical protein
MYGKLVLFLLKMNAMNGNNYYNQGQEISAGEAVARVLTLLGGLYVAGSILEGLFSSESDTVNYILKYRGRVVYHGICYEDRLDARLNEHRRNGIRYDECVYSEAKPRSRACNLERKRIRRDRTEYNIHHNC